MKQITAATFLAASTIMTSTITAASADLPSRAAPPPVFAAAPVYSWTGFYLGLDAGWSQTTNDYTAGAAFGGGATVYNVPRLDKSGFNGGLFAGYNYQVGNIVVGVEADARAMISEKMRYTALTGDFLTAHTNWLGSLRGRLGYAIDNVLIYATGGLAFGSPKSTVTTTNIQYGIGDGTRWGWTLGAGVEYAFTKNWIAGLEYRYADYQRETRVFPVGTQAFGVVGLSNDFKTNQVNARLLYKF